MAWNELLNTRFTFKIIFDWNGLSAFNSCLSPSRWWQPYRQWHQTSVICTFCLNTCNVLDTCLTVGYIRQYFISYPTDKPWDSHRDIQTGTCYNNNPSGHIGQGVKKHFTITVDTYILMSWSTFKSLSMTICTRNDVLHTFWFKSIVRIFGTLIINID